MPIDAVDIHVKGDRGYFGPFHGKNSHNHSHQSGIYHYPFAWWGWLASWFGWSTQLKDLKGHYHYLSRQELDDWIADRKSRFPEIETKDNIYEQIAEICCAQALKKKQQEFERELEEFRTDSRSLAIKKYPEFTKSEDGEPYVILLGGEEIIAKPERMRQSRYFEHILTSPKRSDGRIIFLDELFKLQPDPIDIDEEVFEIFKCFFQGQEIKHLISPTCFKGLYALHKIIDISGIFALIFQTVGFYSDREIDWGAGLFLSVREFLFILAERDPKFNDLYQEKFQSYIKLQTAIQRHDMERCQPSFTHDDYAVKSCPIQVTINEDGSLNLVCEFSFDQTYFNAYQPPFPSKFYENRFSFLNDPNIKTDCIQSIIVDLRDVKLGCLIRQTNPTAYTTRSTQSYLARLLNDLNQHLSVPDHPHCRLIIKGIQQYFLHDLDATYQPLLFNALKGLLQKKWSKIELVDFLLIPPSNLQKLYVFSPMDCCSMHVTYRVSTRSPNNDLRYRLTIALCPAIKAKNHLVIHYDSPDDLPAKYNLHLFHWIKPTTSVSLRQNNQPWAFGRLQKITTEHLKLENIKLTLAAIQDIEAMKNLNKLETENCEMIDCKAEIEALCTYYDHRYKQLEYIQGCIQANEEAEYRHYPSKSCHILYTFHQNDFLELTFQFKPDAYYANQRFDHDYYAKRLCLFNHSEQAGINFAPSIVIDCHRLCIQGRNRDFFSIDYLVSLIQDVAANLKLPKGNKLSITFKGFCFGKLLRLCSLEQYESLIRSFKRLMSYYREITFDAYSQKFLGNQRFIELFETLAVEGQRVEVTCTYHHNKNISNSTPLSLSLAVQNSSDPWPVLNVHFHPTQYSCLAPFRMDKFSSIRRPIRLVIESLDEQADDCKVIGLDKLQAEFITMKRITAGFSIVNWLIGISDQQIANLHQLVLDDCYIIHNRVISEIFEERGHPNKLVIRNNTKL